MDFDETYPTDLNICTPFPDAEYYVPPAKQALPSNPTLKLGYWELLSPTFLGTTGALYLSFLSDNDHLTKRYGETFFNLAIVSYAIGASFAASFAITDVCSNSKTPHDNLFKPIGGALVSIILLFAAEYLLLYRSFPSSFKGDVGDNFWTQLFSFLYLSITIVPGASAGDILPNNLLHVL